MPFFCYNKNDYCDHSDNCDDCDVWLHGKGGKEVPSNADRVRAMSDEELASFLCGISTAECCDRSCPAREMCDIGDSGMIKWLKQPTEEANDECSK